MIIGAFVPIIGAFVPIEVTCFACHYIARGAFEYILGILKSFLVDLMVRSSVVSLLYISRFIYIYI